MQRSERLAVHAIKVGVRRLTHGVVAVEEGPGLYVAVDRVDARETIAHEFSRGDTAVANMRGRFRQTKCAQTH
jgi:hypothetical protein